MNEYELSQNPVLTSFDVKDLNADPTLPYDDASFDKVTCVVSVDYLNKPLEVFKEIGRVLRPGLLHTRDKILFDDYVRVVPGIYLCFAFNVAVVQVENASSP